MSRSRCVETNEYGEQCVLVECHEPNISPTDIVDAYDTTDHHRTARSEEAYTWDATRWACAKEECMRDEDHDDECRKSGWLASPRDRTKPAAPSPAVQQQRDPKSQALQQALAFVSGLNLQDQSTSVQREALAVIRVMMQALHPNKRSDQ